MKYFCVASDCAEFDLGEFIWCESVIGANANGANAIRPYGKYNLSDCHLVGLFSLILPLLIIWVEFDCD